ncbi:hypothetical protein J7E62_03910 [Variovorax paradoxus]|nr:hypothetical protein [Variovorax paradoxus]
MFLRTWRWLTLMFVALSLAPAAGHFLEMPAKMRYEGPLWLTISQTLYGAFGTVGGAFEVGAIITTVVLALLVRRRRPAFGWTLLAALCVLLSHAAFWIWLAPVNATVAASTLATLPENWMALRSQWEYTHAARAVLQAVALGALAISVLAEIPTSTPIRNTR